METWQSDTSDAGDGDVIEIIPLDEYDVKKAKVKASLSWILFKAYRENVPKDFLDPFYQTAEGGWQIKPRLANALANSEIYCQACRYMFGETASQWTGHWSIIQVLSRKGIYAVGSDSVDVTETILMQSAPFRIKAHIALIDALMLAFAREIMSVERVTQSVRRFASFNASSELPSELEDTVVFWINKVCVTQQKLLDQAAGMLEGGETNQKVRIVSTKTPRDSISVPIIESLLQDVSDGCSLATLLSFYCPQILNIHDVCLKSNVGIADSLYNLRLVKSFCDRHLPDKTCHFTYEDLLYSHQSLKENILMMIAEIFYWFEIKPLAIVTGAGLSKGDRPSTAAQLQSGSASRIPSIPISNVTKQSFQRMKGDAELRASAHSPTAHVPPRMPLLHRRHQQGHVGFHDDHGIKDGSAGVHRTHSLTSHDAHKPHFQPRQSVLAWQEASPGGPVMNQSATDRSDRSSNLLGNVSIDSEMNASFSSGSIDLGELDATPRVGTHRSEPDTQRSSQFDATEDQGKNAIHFSLHKQGTPHPGLFETTAQGQESLELESVTPGQQSRMSIGAGMCENEITDPTPREESVEPLLPARLKPAKEKSNMDSKEGERNEVPRRKTPSPPKVMKRVEIDPHLQVINQSVSSDVSITPVPHEDLQMSQDFYNQENQLDPELMGKSPKKFDVFFIKGSVSDSQDAGLLSHRSDVTVAESYVIDQTRTPEAALAAGIPIIDDNVPAFPGRRLSREGSIASSKSSGDFSDHESHKIHHDHKTKETSSGGGESRVRGMIENVHQIDPDFSDPARFIFQKPVIVNRQPRDGSEKMNKFGGNATNFAQIKQMKQFGNVDNSGLVYMQHGKEDDDKKTKNSPLKEAYAKNKSEKKTTFAPLPNQTTWQQAVTNQNEASGSVGENGPVSQEMLRIKMKLEEKRKAIERKKQTQEIQQQKMRQRLGKAAFLHVVAKPKDDNGSRGADEPPARMTNSDPDVLTGSSASTTPDSRMSLSSSSPLKSPPAQYQQQSGRPFCREGIQQTIENVRMKWFNSDDAVAPRMEEDAQPLTSGEYDRNVPYDMEVSAESDERNLASPVVRRPVFDRRSTSVERINLLAGGSHGRESSPHQARSSHERRSMSVERQPQSRLDNSGIGMGSGMVHYGDRRSSSIERSRSDHPVELSSGTPQRRESGQVNKIETNDQFNTSLDLLNQNLSDLQEEIKQLSLKKKEADMTRNSTQSLRSLQAEENTRSRSPPKDLDFREKTLPSRPVVDSASVSEMSRPLQSQGQGQPSRSSSEPRQIATDLQPTMDRYQSHTLPRQPSTSQPQQMTPVMTHQQPMPPAYMVHQSPSCVAGPAGPIYPGQYVSPQMATQSGIPPTAQQYGSYLMGPGPGQHAMVPTPGMPPGYQQSPQQVYPSSMGMYPGHQFPNQQLVSPMYASPPHTLPTSQIAGTYTTSVLQHQQPFPSPVSQPMSFIPTTQPVYPQLQQQQQQLQQQQEYTPSLPSSQQQNQLVQTPIHDHNVSSSRPIATEHPDVNAGGGFFIAMTDKDSPRRLKSKPQLSDRRLKTEDTSMADSQNQSTESDNEFNSSVIADFAKKVAEQEERNQAPQQPQQPADGAKSGDIILATRTDQVPSNQPEAPSVRYVIGQDKTTIDETAEIEMQKKKEKLEKMRLKRQEEQEKKRQRQEQEMNRKREQERIRQEEAERRKSEEKARRELIFKQYLEKKEEDEEPAKREKPQRQKPRPKSMFVKAGPGGDVVEGADNYSSTEDVSRGQGASNATASKFARKQINPSKKQSMRKAVSCNVLNGSGTNGDKSLAFGGMTHRRPPSPDLYGRSGRRQPKSDSSESGSGQGSEYSGPKLFVKPSSKSNRHIITNAISHCCLAGSVNTDLKNKVLEEIAKSSAKHFIILFRDAGCGYRGLYGFDPDSEDCVKIMGVGPRCIHNNMIEKYFKYNSGGKTFSEVVSTKHLSVSIDAIVMNNALWKQNVKAPTKGR